MDFYRTATELYTSSLRALEQRSTAFLFTQSLLVGAAAILFSYFQSDNNIALFVPTCGIAVIGLVFSVIFYISHQVTSKDTAYWRAYMRYLEDNYQNDDIPLEQKPWHLFYKYVEKKERKGLGTRGDASRKLPAPLLWLASPAIFLTAWVWFLSWILQLFFCGTEPCAWFWVFLGILSLLIISITCSRWQKAKDSIYTEITDLAKTPSNQ